MTNFGGANQARDAEFTVEFAEWWADGCRGRSRFAARDGLLWPLHPPTDAPSNAADIAIDGTLFASLTDHHVHLGLVDAADLWAGGLTRVHDLGWRPSEAERWLAESARAVDAESNTSPMVPEIKIVGGLLTCTDGYPRHSGWAPEGATLEVGSAAEAATAVNAQRQLGASAIKITLNSDAGPVPSDELLAAIVEAAHGCGLPVVAHAQGAGQPERALAARVDVLAHAPFSVPLGEGVLQSMVASGMVWISTLDKHGWGEHTPEFLVALDNARRFVDAGGRILYGTDLGDGPLPLGINVRELRALAAAGLDREALLGSIVASNRSAQPAGLDTPSSQARAALDQRQTPVGPRFAWATGLPPRDAAAAASWIATATSLTVAQLKEYQP